MISEGVSVTLEVERQLLGCILLGSVTEGSTRIINELARILKPEHFKSKYHARYYKAMLASPISPSIIATAHQLQIDKQLEKGDCTYLQECIADCIMWLDYIHYAKLIIERSNIRSGINNTYRGINVSTHD